MSLIAQNVDKARYTEASGIFYEGMKREDVDKINNSSTKFKDYHAIFDRIDENQDRELSEDEITYEIYRDIDSYDNTAKLTTALGLASLASSYLTKGPKSKVFGLIFAAANLGVAIYGILQQNKLEKKVSERCFT